MNETQNNSEIEEAKKTAEKKYSIRDLARIVAKSERTIRFYLNENLVDRSTGHGRGAFYTEYHVRQLKDVIAKRNLGMSIEDIKLRKDAIESKDPTKKHILWNIDQRGTVHNATEIYLAEDIKVVVGEHSQLPQEKVNKLITEIIKVLDELEV
jgi:DNA-binding transcriptional MerR regulator